MGSHQSHRAGSVIWLTPPAIVDALGGPDSFDLDPCSPERRPWDTARHHYDRRDDGLVSPWFGRIWLNPPYSASEIGKWLGRMARHNCGTALIFARTETEAFRRFVWEACDSLLFLHGRLHFHRPDGSRSPQNAGAPSVLCAYGADDSEILSGCGLDGAFVPLKLHPKLFGFLFETESSPVEDGRGRQATWIDEVRRAMVQAGRAVPVAELYRLLASSSKASANRHWRAKIRQSLQRGPFRALGGGIWELEPGADAQA